MARLIPAWHAVVFLVAIVVALVSGAVIGGMWVHNDWMAFYEQEGLVIEECGPVFKA